jgi:hypothetical protein
MRGFYACNPRRLRASTACQSALRQTWAGTMNQVTRSSATLKVSQAPN